MGIACFEEGRVGLDGFGYLGGGAGLDQFEKVLAHRAFSTLH
jgi:hypothetical protein